MPEGKWIDYFSGEVYEGGQIINNFDTPIWKLPVFVKAGAIIPMVNPNNNIMEINKELRIYDIYPFGKSEFTEYNDDGFTQAYKQGEGTYTTIKSEVGKREKLEIKVLPTTGNFKGFVKNKVTEFKINVTKKPRKVSACVGNKRAKLKEVKSLEDFYANENVYYYNPTPDFNQFATKGSEFTKVKIIKNPQLLVRIAKTDITKNEIELTVKGFYFDMQNHLLKNEGNLEKPALNLAKDAVKSYTLKPSWEKQANADYYELEMEGMRYSTIKDNSLLIENLTPETDYTLKLRAVNKSGKSDWATLSTQTAPDPLQFAIEGITGEISVPIQEGFEMANLFDREEGTTMHTKYREKAVPFDLIIDLNSYNELDKFHYVPRGDKGNGIFQEGEIFFSSDKKNWTKAGDFTWDREPNAKIFEFANHPTARYIKISVKKAVGDYGSGKEIYVFKVPGTESFIPGDINNDKKIDENDLTSYMNYTGLRQGDSDFEGYVSRGDVNKNGWIDAYDISNVAVQLDGGISNKEEGVTGELSISTPKKPYKAGETVEITVKGKDLKNVNAFSFALPYNPSEYEFISVTPLNLKSMQNLTNDRLHTDGEKVLYPTFVNIGDEESLQGNNDLFIIKLKAKKALKFNLAPQKQILVNNSLEVEE